MKILFDQGTPAPLRKELCDHHCSTAHEFGWSDLSNGKLLAEAEEAHDRGAKFKAYRDLDPLAEYVLISQDKPSIEIFLRQPEGLWLFAAAQGIDAVANLRSLRIDLPLADVYAGIEFAPDLPTL
ncbi:MAG TPA: hypothetical protein VG326_13495 [Tepidisphaeraceae bacterium]|jgi:hypothetical protein|nr:hypothetical protein [Tepidisphaeraceae bacterium]